MTANAVRAVPWVPTDTCREFRGMDKGNCPKDPAVVDSSGRTYCGKHAVARRLEVAGSVTAPDSLSARIAP